MGGRNKVEFFSFFLFVVFSVFGFRERNGKKYIYLVHKVVLEAELVQQLGAADVRGQGRVGDDDGLSVFVLEKERKREREREEVERERRG